jgi:hypothetical protein
MSPAPLAVRPHVSWRGSEADRMVSAVKTVTPRQRWPLAVTRATALARSCCSSDPPACVGPAEPNPAATVNHGDRPHLPGRARPGCRRRALAPACTDRAERNPAAVVTARTCPVEPMPASVSAPERPSGARRSAHSSRRPACRHPASRLPAKRCRCDQWDIWCSCDRHRKCDSWCGGDLFHKATILENLR